ncbi:uncharacterized protein LOC111015565 [Momordica charantia]|uniref:Uncharacterized protein LOC111015565 n=1 Tax=Momordica charantia TaxID=3673 RepID=A0A6J1CZA8_MOMCH|nr:uncharacterized protein LOC111015565 [Momordica charantia]
MAVDVHSSIPQHPNLRPSSDLVSADKLISIPPPLDSPSSPSSSPSSSSSSSEDGFPIQPSNNGDIRVTEPHSQLPKPEAPPGLRSYSLPENISVDMPSIGKFIRERSNSLSAAIIKRISSLKDEADQEDDDGKSLTGVTEINLSGLKVVVKLKSDEERDREIRGRISFFSRSNCRDCKAVRGFFNEKGLRFVEINVDVFPQREAELMNRTGNSSVPQIFFNEKLFGGLVALNSLRNSGEFDRRIKEMLSDKCPDDAPAPPVYGFDDPEEESTPADEMVEIVKFLRQKLPIQDRLIKMKIVKNCFSGSEMVEALIQRLDCGRRKAVEIGKQMARKLFIHHVFGENEFEDGNHFYRFLEHGPFIPRCFNFLGSVNDNQPKPAAIVAQRLAKIMSAILESYASEDLQHVDYLSISNSEEFRRYINLVLELHRVNLLELSHDEKLAFFLNLYNAMVIHGLIRFGRPEGVIDRKSFFSDFQYLVGGQPYPLMAIKNGILRGNKRPPYSFVKPFSNGDKRLELAFGKVNPLIHFGLCNGTKSSPRVRFYTPQGVEAELRCAAREFFQSGGVEVDLDKRTVYLTGIIKWFSVDFGHEKEILRWIMSFLDAKKAGLLTHLLGDGGPVNIAYQNYNWTMNSS